MAQFYQTTDSTGTGVRIVLGTANSVLVATGVTVGSADSEAIIGTGSNQSVQVLGTVMGQRGISLGDSATDDDRNSVFVATTGFVASTGPAFAAIRILGGGSRVENLGTITGGVGVLVGGDLDGSETQIVNRGLISADIAISRAAAGNVIRVENHGTIDADTAYLSAGSNTTEIIVNTGLITGDFIMLEGLDLIDNTGGRIIGNVDLGIGGDTFDNRGGSMQGTLNLGEGDDTYWVGTLEGTVIGGDGILTDTLAFSGPGVRYALDGAFAPSATLRDLDATGFENLQGTAGRDALTGDAAANVLDGRAGADTLTGQAGDDLLRGAAGNDRIIGGGGADAVRGQAGRDTLTGGAGNDTFQFESINGFGDSITDFSRTPGNNDQIVVNALGVPGLNVTLDGVVAAALFRSRADNAAQDADDRFIFRTTDKSLWYDQDGNGTAAPVLLVDLQQSATLPRVAIFIDGFL
jgi:Ca2+-binding RTX toxin-like protein